MARRLFNDSDWQPPRCIHGSIILGCPYEDCPTQMAYLDQQNAAMCEYENRQDQDVQDFVRSLLGLPLDKLDG